MRIRDWMTRDPIIVTPETLVMEAQRMMNEYRIHHLPVVKKGKLVGIVTRRRLLEAAPSEATSLSIHELSYLLTKMTIKDIMEKDVVSVAPDTPVEEVVRLGAEKNIGSFPVVEDGKLVGIATATEITKALLEIFAAYETDVLRLTLLGVRVDKETFPKITGILRDNGAIPLTILSLPWRGTSDRRIVIRCKGPDHTAVIDGLKKEGFVVEKVTAFHSSK